MVDEQSDLLIEVADVLLKFKVLLALLADVLFKLPQLTTNCAGWWVVIGRGEL